MTDNAPAPDAAPAAPPTTSPAASGPWYGDLKDSAAIGFLENKKFADLGTMVKSHQELEKFVGAPKDKLVRIPEPDDKDGWSKVHERLGRPADVNGYEIAADSPEFATWAKQTFYELGLSKQAGETLAKKYQEYAKSQEMTPEAYAAQVTTQTQDLQKEWGQAYERNLAIARQAKASFPEITPEQMSLMEQSMGVGGLAKFFHNIATKIGESQFQGGTDPQRGFGLMTPAAAQARIQELASDREWTQKFRRGEAAAESQWTNLHKAAYV